MSDTFDRIGPYRHLGDLSVAFLRAEQLNSRYLRRVPGGGEELVQLRLEIVNCRLDSGGGGSSTVFDARCHSIEHLTVFDYLSSTQRLVCFFLIALLESDWDCRIKSESEGSRICN